MFHLYIYKHKRLFVGVRVENDDPIGSSSLLFLSLYKLHVKWYGFVFFVGLRAGF